MPAPTVVLLHGQPDSSASLLSLRRGLLDRLGSQVRVWAPDRPGYGVNPLPATDFHGNVTWLQGWLKRIDAGPVVLVGHSWAGGVAILAAAQGAADRGGLVLLSSIGPGCLLRIDPVLAAPVVGAALSYSVLGLGRGVLTRGAAKMIRAHLADDDVPYAWTSGAAMRRRDMWRSFLVEQRALVEDLPRIEGALGRIAVPTHIVSGTEDQTIPDVTPAELASRIPVTTRSRIAGAGHDLQLKQSEQVAADIAPFIAARLGLDG